MMKKYRTGIQKQVLNFIDYNCNILKRQYVTMEELKQELKIPTETDKQLNHRLTQAVYQLKRNGLIKDRGYGKYSFHKERNKYYPKCAHLTTKNKRPYCPIKKHYVQPEETCISIEVFNGTKKVSEQKCIGYSSSKDNKESSKKKFETEKAVWIGNHRFYNGSQYDPESKYFLPRLLNI